MHDLFVSPLNCTCVQELLKYSSGCERVSELQGALAAMLDLLKSVNDSMHQIAITGYEVKTVPMSVLCGTQCDCVLYLSVWGPKIHRIWFCCVMF